jgi:6-phospho-3-hexuloisomerase
MNQRINEISNTVLSELNQVFSLINDSTVRELLELIKSKENIFVLGAGREGLSARTFTMRLMHLGKKVHWIWDDTTPAIGKEDLLICACGSADVGHENHICQMAKNSEATIALITASNEGYILKLADTIVNIPAEAYKAKGDFVKSQQLMGNLFEQTLFILLDVLIMMLREEMQITSQEMVSRHRNVE